MKKTGFTEEELDEIEASSLLTIRINGDATKIKNKLEKKAKKAGFIRKNKKGNVNGYLNHVINYL